MPASLHRHVRFANVVAFAALFVALSTGGAYAITYVVSSNSQVAVDTIAGHQPPSGKHSNLLAGSVNVTDLAAAEAWHVVPNNPPNTPDKCARGTVAVLCGACFPHACFGDWVNAGGAFTPTGFYRDLIGIVHLRGLVNVNGNSYDNPGTYANGRTIFLLPIGYRPTHELVFTTLANDTNISFLVRVDVDFRRRGQSRQRRIVGLPDQQPSLRSLHLAGRDQLPPQRMTPNEE